MHAQLRITHARLEARRVFRALEGHFGAADRSAIQRSGVLGPQAKNALQGRPPSSVYVNETMERLIICERVNMTEFTIHVEPITGDLVASCQSTWRGLRLAMKGNRARLQKLEVIGNSVSGRVVMTGETGALTQLSRRERVEPMLVAVAAGLVVVFGGDLFGVTDTGSLVAGAVSAWIAGALALGTIGSALVRKEIRWRV